MLRLGRGRSGLALALIMAGGASVCPASAADAMVAATPPPLDYGWTFQLSLNAWATALEGDIGIRGLPPSHVDLTAWDAIQDLDGAFAGSFLATDGRWLLSADFMYAKVSDTLDFRRTSGSVEFEQTQILVTALGGVRIPVAVEDLQLYATAGLRYQHYKAKVSVDPAVLRSVDRDGSKHWTDPVVGLSLRYDFNPKWFVTGMADIGGFGVSSHFTTQDTLAVGYNWTDQISSSLGYRVLYTNYDDDEGFSYDTTQHGVIASTSFNF